MIKPIIYLFVLFFLVSCQESKKEVSKPSLENQIIQADTLGGIWNLYKVNDTLFDITEMYGFKTDQPTLKIQVSNNVVSGYSGCNGFRASAKIDSTKIIIADGILATEMGCGGNIWENDFFSRLAAIQSYYLNKDTLTLQNPNTNSLTFLRRHLHPLELNSWQLIKINDSLFDIHKVTRSKNNQQPVIEFNFEKQTLGGWNGCNSFGIEINFKGTHYISNSYMSDARGCDGDWLQKIIAVLKDNQSYEIDNRFLTLKNTKGSSLTFERLKD